MARRTRRSGFNVLIWVLIHTGLTFITGGLWLLFLFIRFLIKKS